MNKAKRARCCNPLEAVHIKGDYDSGYYNFWEGGGGLARPKRAQGGEASLVCTYIFINFKYLDVSSENFITRRAQDITTTYIYLGNSVLR